MRRRKLAVVFLWAKVDSRVNRGARKLAASTDQRLCVPRPEKPHSATTNRGHFSVGRVAGGSDVRVISSRVRYPPSLNLC
jgi:hypothetical protein